MLERIRKRPFAPWPSGGGGGGGAAGSKPTPTHWTFKRQDFFGTPWLDAALAAATAEDEEEEDREEEEENEEEEAAAVPASAPAPASAAAARKPVSDDGLERAIDEILKHTDRS